MTEQIPNDIPEYRPEDFLPTAELEHTRKKLADPTYEARVVREAWLNLDLAEERALRRAASAADTREPEAVVRHMRQALVYRLNVKRAGELAAEARARSFGEIALKPDDSTDK